MQPLSSQSANLLVHARIDISLIQNATTKDRSLSDITIDSLGESFIERNHYPSRQMWVALEDVASTLEQLADGDAEDLIHVSSLDPGVGKTQSVVHFIRALLASPHHRGVAVLICVGRKDQIASMVGEAGLSPGDFAVLTADEKINSLGNSSPHKVRVLFTTHQMVMSRCKNKAFDKVGAFHYRGNVRHVRVWDEGILPGRVLTFSRDDLASLFGLLRGRHPSLVAELEGLFFRLTKVPSGEQLELPDLEANHRLDLTQAVDRLELAGGDRASHVIETLSKLSGRIVTIRRDGAFGETMLDYEDDLPKGLTPMLVLDASSRVRETYRDWEEKRGGIVRLRAAPKDYGNLTIHVWNRAGGKASFVRHRETYLDAIATTIATKPYEDWLVVHHKGVTDGDFGDAVKALLPAEVQPRVHALNWGAHDATNAFGHVPNIILCSLLFYRESQYEGLGRLASGHPSSAGPFSDADRKRIALGEHRHNILQAVSRGAVRRSVDGGCPVTNAYVIAPRPIAATLKEVFPGTKIVRWRPVPEARKGKIGKAVDYLEKRFGEDRSTRVLFKEVMEHVGVPDSGNFSRVIRRHEDFREELHDLGVMEWGNGQRMTCFRSSFEEMFPNEGYAAARSESPVDNLD